MKKSALLIALSIIPLASCSMMPLEFRPYSNYATIKEVKHDIQTDTYYQKKEYGSLEYETYSKQTESISSYRDLYSNTNDGRKYLNFPSTGERKLLVIPVAFTDSDTSSLNKKRILIQNAFFGKEEMTTNESVASFYNKASYGNLKLKGEVSDWYHFPYEGSKLTSKINDIPNYISRYITGKAIEWYKENYSSINTFDSDSDNYIDGVYIIYDFPKGDKKSVYWAYTDHMNSYESIKIKATSSYETVNTTMPYISTYSWSSISFLEENNNIVDTHVLIHETGHIFGLLDYYSESTKQPTGFMDTMDYNIGDHTGFSKMCLNWVTPKVIKDKGTFTLNSFIETGDLLLIPAGKYNDTPYDEYLLLEYYTPKSVNQKDSNFFFTYLDDKENIQKGSLFKTFGIKIYHVDARLVYLSRKASRKNYISFLDDPNVSQKLQAARSAFNSWCVDFAYSNNESNSDYPIYHLLEKSGKNTFFDGIPGNDDTLFKIGDTFGYETFKDYQFHNGNKNTYKIKVENLNPNTATISIS